MDSENNTGDRNDTSTGTSPLLGIGRDTCSTASVSGIGKRDSLFFRKSRINVRDFIEIHKERESWVSPFSDYDPLNRLKTPV